VTSTEKKDLQQIGVTSLARELFESGSIRPYFEELGDFIKFSVCVAIHFHLEPTKAQAGDRFETSQETTRWDSNNAIRTIVGSYKNTETPYRLSQELAEAGFQKIKHLLDSGGALDDLLGD
jgi:hypothetical protein